MWKFPDEILKAIAFHHRPDRLDAADTVPWVVYLANQVCHLMGLGTGTDALSYRGVDGIAARLQFRQRDIEGMMAQLHEQLQGARELLQIVSEPRAGGNGGAHVVQSAHRR